MGLLMEGSRGENGSCMMREKTPKIKRKRAREEKKGHRMQSASQ